MQRDLKQASSLQKFLHFIIVIIIRNRYFTSLANRTAYTAQLPSCIPCRFIYYVYLLAKYSNNYLSGN